jgi:hypothetical protein
LFLNTNHNVGMLNKVFLKPINNVLLIQVLSTN